MDYKNKYNLWVDSDFVDETTKAELKAINDDKEIEDRFYKDLEFGTGGLRGVMGAGSNRLNIYTVGRVTEGLAMYLKKKYENPSVVIAYDSRNMSEEFAEYAARTLCTNGVKTFLFKELTPTPILSFAVRHLNCSAGIVLTASHNPKQYNGYKVYGEDGGQITDMGAKEILSYINSIETFQTVKPFSKEQCIEDGKLTMILEEVYEPYVEKVKSLSIKKSMIKESASDLKVIYTPIHGSGNIPVRRVLKELGYTNVSVVKEQELPDGNFPTAPYPNPEDPKVFTLALKMAEEINPDIIIGTDPDSDRLGVIVKTTEGNYVNLTGNQVGALLCNYVVSSMKEENCLPTNGALIKTIVSTDMVYPIAKKYGIEVMEVLTGFKYIGEMIKNFEQDHSHTFLLGFEESYGYLSGDFVRDKDAIIASMLVCEMTLHYKKLGMSLYEALQKLYKEVGYYKEKLVSIELKGKEGQMKIAAIIDALRSSKPSMLAGKKVVRTLDYKTSEDIDVVNGTVSPIDLPVSNVLKFILEDGSWTVIRPSGTEPKMKIYMASKGESEEEALSKIELIHKDIKTFVN